MRKVLLATTALATVAGFTAVATADVTVGGAVEWRYVSISDDETDTNSSTSHDSGGRMGDDFFGSQLDLTISLSQTTDNGLTFAASQNWENGGGGSANSSISGDFGTIEVVEGTTGICAAASYDVSSVGHAGGHGDLQVTLHDGSQTTGTLTKISGVDRNEAAISCTSSDTTLNYHSPTFGGFSFGIGTGDLEFTDDNSTTSYGAKYSGSMGDVSYTIGLAGYDGVGSSEDGSHAGANVSMGNITLGIGRSVNQSTATSKTETLSYSVNYAVSDAVSLNIGRVDSDNKGAAAATDDKELNVTSVGVKYTIAPGLYFTLNNHNFDYKYGGATKNDGSVIQSEVKMSF